MVNSIDFSSRLGGSKWSILMNYYDFSTRERRSKGSIILNFLIFRLVDQEKRHNVNPENRRLALPVALLNNIILIIIIINSFA